MSAGGADSESGSPACRPFRSIWLSDHIACIFNNLIGFSRHGLLSPLFSITLRKPFYLFQDTFRVRSDPFLAAMASSSPVSLPLVMVGTRREWVSLIQRQIPALLLDFCRAAWPSLRVALFPFPRFRPPFWPFRHWLERCDRNRSRAPPAPGASLGWLLAAVIANTPHLV